MIGSHYAEICLFIRQRMSFISSLATALPSFEVLSKLAASKYHLEMIFLHQSCQEQIDQNVAPSCREAGANRTNLALVAGEQIELNIRRK